MLLAEVELHLTPEFLDLPKWIQLFECLLECGQFTRDYTGRDPLERLPLLKLTFLFLEGLIVLILICSVSFRQAYMKSVDHDC